MTIDQAQKLQIGDRVHFPEDRGEKAGSGIVVGISTDPQTNIRGEQYVWVSLRSDDNKSAGVWPSK